MIALKELGAEKLNHNTIKGKYEELIVNLILNRENEKYFFFF